MDRIATNRVRKVKPERKLSIAAVAEEAGVSTATIHNRYPEIAEKIRQLLNKVALHNVDPKALRGVRAQRIVFVFVDPRRINARVA